MKKVLINLVGQTFNRLTVIKLSHINHRGSAQWYAKCSCGKEIIVDANNLKSGNTKSCGCLQKEVASMNRFIDLTGRVFGELTVLKFSHIDHSKRTMWNVQCSCGNTKIVCGGSLVNGHTRSCGCYKHIHSITDMVGKRFGKLTVKGLVEQQLPYFGHKYLCVCDCGKEKIIYGYSLRAKRSKSCGCVGRDLLIKRNTTHGLSKTSIYIKFKSFKRREKKVIFDTEWTSLMEICLRNYQPTCVVCGATENLATDHVLPLSKGNGLYPGNAVTLCKHHNSIKHTKTLDQLPIEMATKIKEAAESFRIAWSGGF